MAECLERPCEPGIDLLGTTNRLGSHARGLSAWLGDIRVLLVGLLVLLLAVTSITALRDSALRAAAQRSTSSTLIYSRGYSYARPIRSRSTSLSGDAAYDPAAGSLAALFSRSSSLNLSGDDAYDRAAGARPERAFWSAPVSLSGDATYDPAAGSLAALFGQSWESYSGDDAYDPAAGGLP